MKSLTKKAVATLGYEIRKIDRPDSPDLPIDEMLPVRWHSDALPMSNRFFRPEKLQYRPTIYGVDKRLKYMANFLDVRGQRILEIGPLEGHHSILLEKMGISQSIAIEVRAENLEKCARINRNITWSVRSSCVRPGETL